MVYTLTDPYKRTFHYLRLSITDYCNFRCNYCLPNGCDVGKRQFLSQTEIRHVCTAFANLGVEKIRLTGGEPTVRHDFIDIAQTVAEIPGVQKLVFTTNGYKLEKYAQRYRQAGLSGVNVSIDSLDPKLFKTITGHDKLYQVLAGVEEALAVGFSAVKINTVLLKQYNHTVLDAFLDWIKNKPVSVRFIELMQTGTNAQFFKANHLSGDVISTQLLQQGWTRILRTQDAGPAQEYTHPDYQGRIGIIAPYSKDFCATCNRLRVSAQGKLHLCLFGEFGYPLRDYLQDAEQLEPLQHKIKSCLIHKPKSHYLHDGQYGGTPHLASIGG